MGNKLYVRNFSENMDPSELEDLFTTVGDIKSFLVRSEILGGIERRSAHIQMETEQQAMDCIDRFHGYEELGKFLVVTEDKPHAPDPLYRPKKKRVVAKAVKVAKAAKLAKA